MRAHPGTAIPTVFSGIACPVWSGNLHVVLLNHPSRGFLLQYSTQSGVAKSWTGDARLTAWTCEALATSCFGLGTNAYLLHAFLFIPHINLKFQTTLLLLLWEILITIPSSILVRFRRHVWLYKKANFEEINKEELEDFINWSTSAWSHIWNPSFQIYTPCSTCLFLTCKTSLLSTGSWTRQMFTCTPFQVKGLA